MLCHTGHRYSPLSPVDPRNSGAWYTVADPLNVSAKNSIMPKHGRNTKISLTNSMRTFLSLYLHRALGNDLWRQNPVNRHYDYKLIHSRLQTLIEAQENGDVQGLIYIIRSGLLFVMYR